MKGTEVFVVLSHPSGHPMVLDSIFIDRTDAVAFCLGYGGTGEGRYHVEDVQACVFRTQKGDVLKIAPIKLK